MELPINYKKSPWHVRKKAREQYILNQNGLCCHCNEPLDSEPSKEVLNKTINFLFPPNMLDVYLHHSRKTGLTIGAVHAKCNAVLWQYYKE